MKTLFETPDFKIIEEVTGSHNNQTDVTLFAKDSQGNILGYLDYVEFEGTPSISYVEVDPAYRRQGVGTALYKKLQSLYPDKEIGSSGTTPDGTAIRKSLEGELYKDPDKENVINTLKSLYRRDREIEKEWDKIWGDKMAMAKLDNEQRENDAKILELEGKYPPYKTGVHGDDPSTFMESVNSIVMKMYHGSNQDVDTFKHGVDNKGVTSKYGFWFTDSIDEAKQYGKQSSERIRPDQEAHEKKMESYMRSIESAERSGDWELYDRLTQEMEELEFGEYDNSYHVYTVRVSLNNPFIFDASNHFDQETVIKSAIEKGHDGVIFKNISDSPYGLKNRTNQVVAFNSDSIKILDKRTINNPLTESVESNMDELSELMDELSEEHDRKSTDELTHLALNVSEKEFLRELISGEERYKYRKYLSKFSYDVPTDSLISNQDIEGDRVEQWSQELEFKRPVIIVSGNSIIDGHHKYQAYKLSDIDTVPVVQINDLLDFYHETKKVT